MPHNQLSGSRFPQLPLPPSVSSEPPCEPFPRSLFPSLQPSACNLLSLAFLLLTSTLFLLPFRAGACGLDWTLPQAHFEGVDENGYVAYWEKIGQADLGDGLIIPVNIGFNSRRETSSPTLGKGWVLPLLESHVEPVDENTMHVIMPDGWIFTFLRNGSSDTWRGNAGWVGQTDNTRFTITAPCGWRVKFDTGHILEIDTPKNRTISIKYNGPAPVEADVDTRPFVQVDSNTATGVAQDIVIGDQKILMSQAPRPRIQAVANKNLITGFDSALSQLQYPNNTKETFDFTVPPDLTPTLAITKPNQPQRNIEWDSTTSQIKSDGEWTYNLKPSDNVLLNRSDAAGQSETYFYDSKSGTSIEGTNGTKIITITYVNAGVLNGQVRSVTQVKNGVSTILRRNDYDEKGRLIRALVQMTRPHEFTYKYNADGKQAEIDVDNKVWLTKIYDSNGRLIQKNLASGAKMTYAYIKDQIQKTTILANGKKIVIYLNARFQPLEDLEASVTK